MLLYIGGGTPSIVSIENIEKIMNAARKHFDFDPANMEVSLETTPRIAAVDFDKLKAYLSFTFIFFYLFNFIDVFKIPQNGN